MIYFVKLVKRGNKSKTIFQVQIFFTSRPLELLHLDLFGPTKTTSVSGKRYGLLIVDDYSRWTLVMFLAYKDESFGVFFKFYKRIKNEKGVCIASIRSDHVESLKMKGFIYSIKKMAFFIISLLLKHHNKML